MTMNVYGPFDIDPVLQRLRAMCVDLRQIDQAAELASVYSDPAAVTPAAFVLPPDERAGESNYSSGMVRQNVSVRLPIVLRCRNFRRGELGSDALASLPLQRLALRTALLRWTPTGADRAMAFGESRVIRYDSSTVYSLETFTTEYRIRVSS